MPTLNFLVDAVPAVVVVPVVTAKVIRLRDVDEPSWSRDVCLLCLVLALSAVGATVVEVLTMLTPSTTAGDARVLLDKTVTTLVVSVVSDALRIAVVAAVLEILFNTVLVTPGVWSAFELSVDVSVDADPTVVVALIAIVDVIRLRDVDKPSVPPPSPC